MPGNLAETGYAELVRELHDRGHTGRLVVSSQSIRKVTCFREGRVVFARSNDPNDRLGEFLLRRGTIQLQHYLESASRIAPGRRQGAILCEMGAIDPDDLFRLLTEQVTEILYTQFDWARGEWHIESGLEDVDELLLLNLPVEEVILTGARRIGDWARIWRGLGSALDSVFMPTESAAALRYRVELSEEDAHLLSLVNGRLSLGRLLALSYGTHFDTCRTLWGLKVAGAIAPVGAPTLPATAEEDWALAEQIEAANRVFTNVHAFVTERIGDLVEHFFDRAVGLAAAAHPRVLEGVHMRNQGRLEYEDVFAHVSGESASARRELTSAAIDEVLGALLALAAKELGPEEAVVLREELVLLARELPESGIERVLRRGSDDAS